MEQEDGSRSISRAAAILNLLADSAEGVGLTALGAQVGLGKSSTNRILRSLREAGFVATDSRGRNMLGEGILALGLKAQEAFPLRHEVHPYLHLIREAIGESTGFQILIGDRFVCLAQEAAPEGPTSPFAIGTMFVLHRTATGRVLLAFQDEAYLRSYYEANARLLDPEIYGHGLKTFLAAITTVRRQRWSVSRANQANNWFNSLAIPLVNAHDEVLGAICVTGPSSRFGEAALDAAVPHVAELLTPLVMRLAYFRPNSPAPGPRRPGA